MIKILSFIFLVSPTAFATPEYLINLNRWDLPWSIDRINVDNADRSRLSLIDSLIPNTIGFDKAFGHLYNIKTLALNFSTFRTKKDLDALAEELKEFLSASFSTSESIVIGLEKLTLNQHIVRTLKTELQFFESSLWSLSVPTLAEVFKALSDDDEARISFFKTLGVASLDELHQKIETKFSDNKNCQAQLTGG